MSIQIAVRIPEELVSSLDGLVREGRFISKAEAIRSAIEHLVDTERRKKIGEAIVDGYLRIPPDDDPGLDSLTDALTSETLADLDADEREAGLEW